MSASIDVIGLWGDYLFEGSLAGVPFWLVDSDDEGGRRVLRFLFPGQDIAVYQDLGQIDGEIVIAGLLIGDDYTDQADQLRTVFRSPGPWTLVHPWLGEMLVVQAGDKLPKIALKSEELRVARFSASFFPYSPPVPPAPDTLQDLLSSLDDVRDAAGGLLDAVLAPAALTVAAIGVVDGVAGTAIGAWNGLLAVVGAPIAVSAALAGTTAAAVASANALVQTAAAAPLAVLAAVGDLAFDVTYAGSVAAAFGGVSAAIAGTSTPEIPAAVAPGGATATPAAVDGRITANLILGAAAALTTASAAPATQRAVTLAAQALALADAVSAASDIPFESQQEAATWQQNLTAALSGTATQAALLAASQATAAGTLWRSLVAAQSALAADMTAAIGRLPAVITFTAPGPAPVWLIAQYLAGDTPSRVVPVYLDLVARNGIVNPGAPVPGPLEVLL